MSLINLNPAHDRARSLFAGASPVDAARRAAVQYDENSGFLRVPFLGREYLVSHPGGEITLAGGGEEVSLTFRVCILHYLVGASDVSPSGRHVSFKELPNGSIYTGPFNNRAIRPLVAIFGRRPDMLVQAGEKIGGKKVNLGDWAVEVNVFPKIPLTFVLWEGDDEFPPSGGILYDSTAPMHLETEDYALLPGLAVFELKKIAGL